MLRQFERLFASAPKQLNFAGPLAFNEKMYINKHPENTDLCDFESSIEPFAFTVDAAALKNGRDDLTALHLLGICDLSTLA